ncbi:circadian clock KaiB family protein [Archangium sp.]|uniref:circadian clock KaiB family protein n=1 Tax=Archangium sp. TaxID=1872627 RepID=UPI002D3371ED|nr:circadian clock KaiB family protein [Archangium sp.]HYO58470.1 circadian clock KaiB family protein [Archangium sp.]
MRHQTTSHAGEEKFIFRLYIAGAKPRSSRALVNCRRICDTYLKGNYELEVIDIYQHPELAAREQIIAVPALVKEAPSPKQKLVGDLSDASRVLAGFGIAEPESDL